MIASSSGTSTAPSQSAQVSGAVVCWKCWTSFDPISQLAKQQRKRARTATKVGDASWSRRQSADQQPPPGRSRGLIEKAVVDSIVEARCLCVPEVDRAIAHQTIFALFLTGMVRSIRSPASAFITR